MFVKSSFITTFTVYQASELLLQAGTYLLTDLFIVV